MTISKYSNQFVECHDGVSNRVIHIIGFTFIGFGIIEKNLPLVIVGGITQELGHFYEYFKTKHPKANPLYCLKSQSIFAYPIFILIILYIIFAK